MAEKEMVERGMIEKAKAALDKADAILVGASNGLSISEGYHIFACNEMFMRQFGDFYEQYGVQSVLQGCMAHYPGREAFVERVVRLWVEEYKPTQVMRNLYALVSKKPYFVLITNADEHLETAGFEAERVFEIEGTFARMRSGEGVVDRRAALNAFIAQNKEKQMVFLELGIGVRNQIIKAPMMQAAAVLPNVQYIAMNMKQELWVEDAIRERAILLAGDIGETLKELMSI